jgi:hypothetical protein
MAHDATKVLMGATKSSFKNVDNKAGTIAAGTVVRLKSDDTISVAKADGNLLGVSLGKDLSDIGSTAIVRKGTGVPVLLTDGLTPVIGAQVHINDTTGKADASGSGKTGVNAVYVTSTLTGVLEDGTTANVAIIDFPGGL